MLEKITVNLMTWCSSNCKTATPNFLLTEVMVREIINSEILPEGSIQLICGS